MSSGISADTQAMMAFESSKKSTGIAYLLWFLTGGVGGHRFYLKRPGSAVAMIALTILGWGLLAVYVGGFLLLALGLWLLVDAFRIPGMVADLNGDLMKRLTASANSPSGVADELQKFLVLKEQGVITEEEFQAQKARIMERLQPSIITGR